VSGLFAAGQWATYLESFIETTAKGAKDIRVLVEALVLDQRGVWYASASLAMMPEYSLSRGFRGKSLYE
jgi:hypothetical protein